MPNFFEPMIYKACLSSKLYAQGKKRHQRQLSGGKKVRALRGRRAAYDRKRSPRLPESGRGLGARRRKIKKEFSFPKYLDGVDFAAKVAGLAEQEGHHPKIIIDWRKVRIELMTHAISGLSENDFILAAKIEKIALRF